MPNPDATTDAASSGPVWVWGLPLVPWTFAQTLEAVDRLIEAGRPGYFITANLHYAMLTAADKRLPAINEAAHFVIADGMPLVWASRWRTVRLPERVAGSDLVPALCERAAQRGRRVFLLGGAPGIGDEAGRKLRERFPTLQIVGIETPPFRALTPEEQAQLLTRIRDARPDLLFVAFGQPKGEVWLAENREALGVPVAVQIGASLDFVAGRVRRAPRWIQRLGIEWAYRLSREPARLVGRYTRNALFALRMLLRDFITRKARRR
jgi:N-acetylglucosaminyldiphosphoundecaprenol N-acetyl-beta-D-mannosaminyltransferase